MNPANSSNSKKKMSIGKKTLIGVAVLFAMGILGAALDDKEQDKPLVLEKSTTEQPAKIEEEKPTPATVEADPEKTAIIEKLKARAARDWPDDYTTQEFWVNEQITAYEYMKTIPDTDPIKKKAARDWPLDFTTQQFWYNEQIAAKERLK